MGEPTASKEGEEIQDSLRFRENRLLDPALVDALQQFAAEASRKNVKVFCFISPGALLYDLHGNASLRMLEEVTGQAGIPFLNFRAHREFLRPYALFADSGHRNDAGARRYSRLVADAIRAHLGAGTSWFSLLVRARSGGPDSACAASIR